MIICTPPFTLCEHFIHFFLHSLSPTDFCVFNSPSVKSDNSTQTASQVMGHILTLNNTLPNDLDFDSLQGGLECDVNSVIQHELSVEGNLEFNFDPAAAAAAAANNASVPLVHGASTRSWVH